MNEESICGTVLPSRHQPPVPSDRAIREESPDSDVLSADARGSPQHTHALGPSHGPRGERLPGASDPAT